MESLWPRPAELPPVVESCEYDRLHAVLAHEFQRVTTHCGWSAPAPTGSGRTVLARERWQSNSAEPPERP
jgi:hypothetical protein